MNLLSKEELDVLKANQVYWLDEMKKLASVPVVQVCMPGATGTCGDCNSEVEGIYTTAMLPDNHPGKMLEPAFPMSFVRTDFRVSENDTFEVAKTSLVCMPCALKLDEVSGYWRGNEYNVGSEEKKDSPREQMRLESIRAQLMQKRESKVKQEAEWRDK